MRPEDIENAIRTDEAEFERDLAEASFRTYTFASPLHGAHISYVDAAEIANREPVVRDTHVEWRELNGEG